jgi:hypothetical protein
MLFSAIEMHTRLFIYIIKKYAIFTNVYDTIRLDKFESILAGIINFLGQTEMYSLK